MGLKNFIKNTKRVNSASYIGSLKGNFTDNKWFGVNIENNFIVIWSNSSEDILLKNADILNCEKIDSLNYKVSIKDKGDAEIKFVIEDLVDIFLRFLETGV